MTARVTLKSVFAAFVAAFLLLAVATPSEAQSGRVRLNVTNAGFIVGIGGGSGTLVFRGRSYPLTVGGINVGTLGIASADLAGTARNLRRPEDIAGTYAAAGAGAAVIAGGKVATLQNEHGVVLNLRGVQAGLQVQIGLGGMTLAMR